MGLVSFLLRCNIVMQAIWCLKFWNMTKYGGQFVLASHTSNSRGLVPCPQWFTPMCGILVTFVNIQYTRGIYKLSYTIVYNESISRVALSLPLTVVNKSNAFRALSK